MKRNVIVILEIFISIRFISILSLIGGMKRIQV